MYLSSEKFFWGYTPGPPLNKEREWNGVEGREGRRGERRESRERDGRRGAEG
jgi:hypothetical protein